MASDIHIEEDAPVMAMGPAEWHPVPEMDIVSRSDFGSLLDNLDPDWEHNIALHAISRPLDVEGFRLRINVYLNGGGMRVSASVRQMPRQPLPLEQTGLPGTVRLMLDSPRGLILVVGATGSGKTTTIGSLVHTINLSRSGHVITIEDPIEYVHQRKKCIFSHREVGVDVASFVDGVRDAMRQRPNVIVVGEIRDRDTAAATLQGAESGHLMIASIHGNSAVSGIQKLLGFFDASERDAQVATLANTLVGVIHQVLLPRKARDGRALACELLLNHRQQMSAHIGNQDQLQAAMDREESNVTLTASLTALVKAGVVSKGDALRAVSYHQDDLYKHFQTHGL
jgi:twitching motility protein PilT